MIKKDSGAFGSHPDLDVNEFENRLYRELARLKLGFHKINEKTFSMSQRESVGVDSAYDQHPGDLGSETFERGKDLGLKDGLEIAIARTKAALNRIEQGSYGHCLRCKKPIPIQRLKAAPEVELCVTCQKEQEVVPANKRPVEEQLIRQDFPGEGPEQKPGEAPPLDHLSI